MKTFSFNIRPYKVGHKIKIYLSEDFGVFKYTFGIVKSVDESNRPTLTYKDLSELSLSRFDRLVKHTEIVRSGRFIEHKKPPLL